MEVGQAATYVDFAGNPRDCLIAKIGDGKASIVVVNVIGPEDHVGRLRSELTGIPVGKNKGCVMKLDSWEDPAAKPAKKTAKKKATKKKAS